MSVPCYPDFAPLDLDLKDSLHPRLSLTADGVSEFTFAGLYLFRDRYQYRISRDGPNGGFIISGMQPSDHRSVDHRSEDHGSVDHKPADHGESAAMPGKKFFMTPCGAPCNETLEDLFKTHDYWKNISDSVLAPAREELERQGVAVIEDRENFDYLYFRKDLAELSGKKYHKKKNLVNQFVNAYAGREERQLTPALVPQAVEILDRWRQDKGEDGDYRAAREALELFETLKLRGAVYFVEGRPAAYCLGESLAKGRMFAIHFEKAVDEYKGIYQFMNQAFAAALPRFFTYINREQDLGDEGLRQAKMTYRPAGFVQKYIGRMPSSVTACA